jgi:hypothetical protein
MPGLGGEYTGRVFERRSDGLRVLVTVVGSGKVWWRDDRQWANSGSTPIDEFKRDFARIDGDS